MQIVGPALVMLMVGSLVFFGIEVIYRGPHAGRLYWVMGLFTFASVLVSRISVEDGRERAQLFGIGLGVATFIASTRLIEFEYSAGAFVGPSVILALIALVMWTSAKLTWDCTVVDNSRDSSAMGLLETFRKDFSNTVNEAKEKLADENRDIISNVIRSLLGTSKRNSPGLWVFYFALMAFPIFGFGQWFVQPDSKIQAFLLFSIYLGSTLCLLMTTSLLGLERYLAKRQLHVPNDVAANWLIVGGVFAALITVLVLLLPKPASSNSIQDWLAMFTSPSRETSKLAMGDNDDGDTPNAKKKRIDNDGKQQGNQARNGKTGVSKEKGEKGRGERDGQKGQPENDDSSKQNPQQNESDPNNKDNSKQQNKAGKQSKRPNINGKPDKQQPEKNNKPNDQKPSKQNSDTKPNKDQQSENRNRKQTTNKKAEQQPREQQAQANKQPNQQNANNGAMKKLAETLSKGMNVLVYAIGFLALLFLAWAFRKELVAFFRKKKMEEPVEADQKTTKVAAKPVPPFSSFRNPFTNGKASKMPPKQLVDYSLSALEAWARNFGITRLPDETAEEFARELAAKDPRIADLVIAFTKLYSLCAFSQENVSREQLKPLLKLWQYMERTGSMVANKNVAVPN